MPTPLVSRRLRPLAFLLVVPSLGLVASAQAAVDTSDRAAVAAYYRDVYQSSSDVPIAWSPGAAACDPGSTTPAFRDAVLRRINYFRAMAGVPDDIVLDDALNRSAQAAAHLMSVNGKLSHTPPSTWDCWSQTAYDGASRSNLYLGVGGVAAIDGYMRDPGSNNAEVGHRRWLLHPPTERMGTGDVPSSTSGRRAANALYVIDGNTFSPHPPTRDGAVAWPPAGYVPYDLAYARWHFSTQQADFTAASVRVERDGVALPVAIESYGNRYGLGFVTWRMNNLPDWGSFLRPEVDESYDVTISGATLAGAPAVFEYRVTLIDPLSSPGDSGNGLANTGAGLLAWQRGYGERYDAQDLAEWISNFGALGGATGSQTPLPEPTAGLLAGWLVLGLAARRRRSKASASAFLSRGR